jgi:putative spermidine/putrescine transport system substrate-binding protein
MNTGSSKQQVGKGGCRWILAAALGAAAAIPLSVTTAWAAPVTLNIVDVAGNLALTQDAIDNYVKKNPDKISKVTHTKAPSPNCPATEGHAGRGSKRHRLVLTGTDFSPPASNRAC